MTSKTTIGLMAASLALVALAPLGSAVVTDDTLSRNFTYVSGTRAEAAPDGIGWYDAANPPNICLITLLGVQAPLVGTFYYETARVYTNLPGLVTPTTLPGAPFVPVPCPAVLNPLCTALTNCGIYITPVTLGPNARTIIPQDGLVCTQASGFVSCVVTAAEWDIAGCRWFNANFDGRPAGSNKGNLAGTGLENLVMSADINCGAWFGAYDVSYLLGSGGDLLSSGFDGVSANLIFTYGGDSLDADTSIDDTGFGVSCLKTTVTEIDSSTPIPTITPGVIEDGVDWAQYLDLDVPAGADWIGDLTVQFVTPGNNGQLVAGLYDLGGNNDCEFAGGALPTCHDGLDNDNDNLVDEGDPDCYSGSPPFYNPALAE